MLLRLNMCSELRDGLPLSVRCAIASVLWLGSLRLLVGCGGTATTPVATPAVAALSATTVSFPAVTAGTTGASSIVTLSNTGGQSLLLSSYLLSDTANYAVATNCGRTLAAAASCAFTLVFQPQSANALPATLTVTDNSGGVSGAQQVVGLNGTGLPIPLPQASLLPGTATFGSVNVGALSTAQAFTLRNTGNATLAVAGMALSDTADFQVTSGCGSTLAAGASCPLSVTFKPGKAGALTATLTASDNSGAVSGTPQVVQLSGTGVVPPAPQAVLMPSALSFPDTMQTESAAAQTVTLLNGGNAAMALSQVVLSDTVDFTLGSSCGATVAAGASCTLTVGFTPQSVASFGATLTVTDNSGMTSQPASGTAVQQTVAISGKGIALTHPNAAVSPATLVFPRTVTNASAPAQTVTLTNTGTALLTVSGVAVSGTSATAFVVTGGNCLGTLPPGASCTETVTYSPKLASAADSASLLFTDDALGQAGSTQSVALTGSALAEVDSVENFGDSITCGFYAQPNDGTGLVYSLEGYAGLFDTYLGVPAGNWCRQGDTAADLSRQWVPFHSTPTSTDHQLYTVMIGANDAYRYGIPQTALSTYTQEVGAALAWLALPNSDKVLANAATQQTGTWSPDVGFGLISSDARASLSFNVNQAVAGRNLYVVYHVWALPYGQAGKASIAVDGAVQATVEESQNSGAFLPTENGTYDTYLVQTVPLGAAGPHTVTFTSVGPSGSAVGLLWAGVAQADYHAVDGAPRVLVGLITNSPSGNQTYAADIFNLQLKSLVPAMAADGMNLVIVPTDRVLDPGGDFVDLLHPNNAGHAKLAAAFEQYR